MASYRVSAWKYNYVREVCDDGSLKRQEIQIPYSSIENTKPPIIARYLEKKNVAHEVILIRDLSFVIDDLGQAPCQAEAHGVMIAPNEQPCRPIWVFEDGGDINLEPPYYVDVFDLNDYSRLKVKASTICWVPHLQDANGNLVTLLKGFPKHTRQKTLGARVLMQEPGKPEATKLAWKPVTELRGNCRELDSNTKRILFEEQLIALQAWLPPPESPAVDAIAPVEEARTVLQDNMDLLRFPSMKCLPTPDASEDIPSDDDAHSDWTAVDRGNTPLSDSSDEEMLDEPSDDEALVPRSDPWYCCRYARLGPTWFNHGRPRHRHGSDEECAMGSDHDQHCIFADAHPEDCVIPEEGGTKDGGNHTHSHTHCLAPIQGVVHDHAIDDFAIDSDVENEGWDQEPFREERVRFQFSSPLPQRFHGEGPENAPNADVLGRHALRLSEWDMAAFMNSTSGSDIMDIDAPERHGTGFRCDDSSIGRESGFDPGLFSPPPPPDWIPWE
ncbi:hypothetical protein E8E14_006211 [Neopestalotiopsis sp. 37M]|nr:hypothetical protein E8E14_006211 [Neopestalotiopsis sp. 37M]